MRLCKHGLLLAGLVASAASATPLTDAVRHDTEWLAGYPSRGPGTEGHAAAQRELLERVRAIPGIKVWTQEFPVVTPVLKRAELVVGTGAVAGVHAVYPLWPDLVRLKTTPEEGLSGQPRYVGKALPHELPARSLKGQIAVMEMADCENWRGPFAMGAVAVLLVGGPADRARPPAQQALYFPRYYVPAGPLADALRRDAVGPVTIRCDAEWATVTGRNICALVTRPGDGARSLPPVALAAPYDAMSVVMGLAPGADNAVDAALLLNLARQAAADPPPRSVLFCFVDAYGINQLGMRQLLTLLTVTPADGTRQDYRKQDEELLKTYAQAAAQVEALGTGSKALDGLWNKHKYRDLQRYAKDVVGPEILRLKEESSDLRLKIHRAAESARPPLKAELDRKVARVRRLNGVLAHVLTGEPTKKEDLPLLLEIWTNVATRAHAQLAALRKEMTAFEDLDTTRTAILAAMGRTGDAGVPVNYLIGVDLSDAGVSVGPGLLCAHLESNETAPASDFMRWIRQQIKNFDDPFWAGQNELRKVLNLESIAGVEDPQAFNPGHLGLISSPAASFQLPAATWLTLDTLRPRVDTPQDRADLLDWRRLSPQVDVTARLLTRLLADPAFAPALKSTGSSKPKWRIGGGSVVAESVSETVARTPMPGCLVTLVGGSNKGPGPEAAAGLRRHEFVRTGPDGRFRFPPLPGLCAWNVAKLHVQAFDLDARGRITHAVSDSASMIAGRVSSTVQLTEGAGASPARVVTFECRELNGPQFFDPRFLEPLSQFSLLDVRRGGTPKRYHFSVHLGQMFGLLKPETMWQLILRSGAAGNRMVLLNLDPAFPETPRSLREALQGAGFGLDEPLPSIPSHISARDLFTVDTWRMARFREAGITSKAIDAMHADTRGMLAAADKALAADDGGALQRAAASALANEIRAYDAVRSTGDDVTRGAIFLMILLVPFAVAMERLLLACARIGRRIGACVAIFAIMSFVLWTFHPSFRITTQPLVIVMSFAILLLSLFVVVMILSKFETDLEELRSGRAESSGAQTRRGGVIGSALWLGIGNMRKRKVRTALTGITIVLITFALLCFSSSTYYQAQRQFSLRNVRTLHPGVLIRQPRMRAMQPQAASSLANLLHGQYRLAERYWWTGSQPAWRIHVRNPADGKQVSLKAGLGLTALERDLTGPDRFMPNWDRFAAGGACYLSTVTAEALGVKPGDPVVVAGKELALAGVFDPAAVSRDLTLLDGQSLLPYDYTVQSEVYGKPENMETEMAAGLGIEPETDVPHVSGDEMIVLPAEFAREAGGFLRSLAVRTEDAAAAEALALRLMKVLAFPMYYGAGDNVKVVVATPLIPRPPRSLIVPLAIAALILFNTMLNSVAERKKEIHIYTSLGLAPRHVGMLFLAEAVTYGLMGSVFGYVIGQGLATVLTRFDLMGGITLNYSGSNVVMTMGMVLFVVVLSSIVPAIMAGRLATPSKEMKWSVPEPRDGVIRDLLPFTVTRRAAGGLAAFIYEFMDAHREGSIGRFMADNLEVLPPTAERVAGIKGTTWLAPYDLGVRQDITIEICEDIEEICNIRVELTYGSGQSRTWWRLNRIFLSELRRQLLGWHNVKPERVLEYIRMADRGTPVLGTIGKVEPATS